MTRDRLPRNGSEVKLETDKGMNTSSRNGSNGSGSKSILSPSALSPSPSRFLPSPMTPDHFIYPLRSFVSELQDYTKKDRDYRKNTPIEQREKTEWLQIHHLPERIIATLKRQAEKVTSKSAGYQLAIRCAVEITLPSLWSHPLVKELISLESTFNQMPQTGEARELFVFQYFATPLRIDFGGTRYNVPCSVSLHTSVSNLSKSINMLISDIVIWCLHLALLRDANDIPNNYREEWENKVREIEELISTKIEGAYGFLSALSGGQISRIVPRGLRNSEGEDFLEN